MNDLFGFIDEKGDLGEGPAAFAVSIQRKISKNPWKGKKHISMYYSLQSEGISVESFTEH